MWNFGQWPSFHFDMMLLQMPRKSPGKEQQAQPAPSTGKKRPINMTPPNQHHEDSDLDASHSMPPFGQKPPHQWTQAMNSMQQQLAILQQAVTDLQTKTTASSPPEPLGVTDMALPSSSGETNNISHHCYGVYVTPTSRQFVCEFQKITECQR